MKKTVRFRRKVPGRAGEEKQAGGGDGVTQRTQVHGTSTLTTTPTTTTLMPPTFFFFANRGMYDGEQLTETHTKKSSKANPNPNPNNRSTIDFSLGPLGLGPAGQSLAGTRSQCYGIHGTLHTAAGCRKILHTFRLIQFPQRP